MTSSQVGRWVQKMVSINLVIPRGSSEDGGGYAFATLVCQLMREAGSNKLQELDGNYRPPLAPEVVGLL